MLTDTDRAVSALHAIPNDLPGDDWLRASMGAKSAGVDFDAWHEWCRGASNYRGESDCRTRWKSIDENGAVKAGTLFKTAAEHGWRIGGKTAPRPAPAKSTPKPLEPPRKPAPGMSAAEVWERLEPAPASHAYAVHKQLCEATVKQLRQVPANDAMVHYRGWLAVPGYSMAGTLQTIEFVPPEVGSNKMTLKGSQKSGAMFSVGPDTGPITVVEGLATASAVFGSTGGRAVSTFGCGNTRRIVEALRQKEPDTRIIIAPDRGKEPDAQKIAAEFNCAVACLPESEPDNFDVNDLFCRDGFDVVQGILENATEPPKPEPKVHPLARFVEIDGTAKPPRWVIPGFIGHGVTVISGAHGVGKTTALLPLALTAAGLHGDDLLPCQWRHVIYCTEDVEQARRILAGITLHSTLSLVQ